MKKVLDEIFVPSVVTLSFTFVVSFLNTIIGDIVNWDLFLSPITNKFCEVYQGGFIKQPVNTWTNLSYLFVGTIMLRHGIKDLRDPKTDNFLVRFPLFSILMGVAAIYVFFGSFFYHASMSVISRRVDGSGVMACFLLPSFYFLFRLLGLYNTKKWTVFMLKRYHLFILLFLLLNYLLFLFQVPHREFSITVVILGVVIISVSWYKFKNIITYDLKYIIVSLLSLIVGFSFWIMDLQHVNCSPDGFVQFHGIWHILTGISLYYAYKFYRSEKKISDG